MANDVNVTIGGDTINVTLGQQVTVKDIFQRKTFTGDGTNQTITLDGNTARANSIVVLFSGIPGELDVDYTVIAARTSITLANSFPASRKGEIRYVKD